MRWAAASSIGTQHERHGSDLQDAYWVGSARGFGMAVVSDGAGSAEYGRSGAWLTCRHLAVSMRDHIATISSLPDEETVSGWIEGARERIRAAAAARDTTPRQFAATVTAVIFDTDELVAFQVGDSASAVFAGGEWSSLIWPETGEYASSTFFVTDEPDPTLRVVRETLSADGVALFSDGVGELALSVTEQRVFERFLTPMLGPVLAGEGEGRMESLSRQLESFLASEKVCERTDDDKTLVLIAAGGR